MQKRGQVTVFVMIGLVALMVIVLLFFARNTLQEQITKATDVEKYLNMQANAIQGEITECTTKKTKEAAEILAAQAGYFNPTNFIAYYGKKVGFRCTNRLEERGCQNDPIIKTTIVQKIEERLNTEIASCIDLSTWKTKDFQLHTEELQTSVALKEQATQVEVNYPITLKRNEVTITRESTIIQLPIPLEAFIEATNKILNKEAKGEQVDPLLESIESNKKYTVEIKKPYPHRVYIITTPTSELEWWFAIEGEGRYVSAY